MAWSEEKRAKFRSRILELVADDSVVFSVEENQKLRNLIRRAESEGLADKGLLGKYDAYRSKRYPEIAKAPLVDAETGQPVTKTVEQPLQIDPRTGQRFRPGTKTVPLTGQDLFVGGNYFPNADPNKVQEVRGKVLRMQAEDAKKEVARFAELQSALEPTGLGEQAKMAGAGLIGYGKGTVDTLRTLGAGITQGNVITPIPLETIAQNYLVGDVDQMRPDTVMRQMQQPGRVAGFAFGSQLLPTAGAVTGSQAAAFLGGASGLTRLPGGSVLGSLAVGVGSFGGALGYQKIQEAIMRRAYGEDQYKQLRNIIGYGGTQAPGAELAGTLSSIALQGKPVLATGIGGRQVRGLLGAAVAGRQQLITGTAEQLGPGARSIQEAVDAASLLRPVAGASKFEQYTQGMKNLAAATGAEVSLPSKFDFHFSNFLRRTGAAPKEAADSFRVFNPGDGSLRDRLSKVGKFVNETPGATSYVYDAIGEQGINLAQTAVRAMTQYNNYRNDTTGAVEPPSLVETLGELAFGSLFIGNNRFTDGITKLGSFAGDVTLAGLKKIPGAGGLANQAEANFKEAQKGIYQNLRRDETVAAIRGERPESQADLGIRSRLSAVQPEEQVQLGPNEQLISLGRNRVVVFNPVTGTTRDTEYYKAFPTVDDTASVEQGQRAVSAIDLIPTRPTDNILGRRFNIGGPRGQNVVVQEGDAKQQVVGLTAVNDEGYVVVREVPDVVVGGKAKRGAQPQYSVVRVADITLPGNRETAETMLRAAKLRPADKVTPDNDFTAIMAFEQDAIEKLDKQLTKEAGTGGAKNPILSNFPTKVTLDRGVVVRGRIVGMASNDDVIVQLMSVRPAFVRVDPVNIDGSKKVLDTMALPDLMREIDMSGIEMPRWDSRINALQTPDVPLHMPAGIDIPILLNKDQMTKLPEVVNQAAAVDEKINELAKSDTEKTELRRRADSILEQPILDLAKDAANDYEIGSVVRVLNQAGDIEPGVVMENSRKGPIVYLSSLGGRPVIVPEERIAQAAGATPKAPVEKTAQQQAREVVSEVREKGKPESEKKKAEPKAKEEPQRKQEPSVLARQYAAIYGSPDTQLQHKGKEYDLIRTDKDGNNINVVQQLIEDTVRNPEGLTEEQLDIRDSLRMPVQQPGKTILPFYADAFRQIQYLNNEALRAVVDSITSSVSAGADQLSIMEEFYMDDATKLRTLRANERELLVNGGFASSTSPDGIINIPALRKVSDTETGLKVSAILQSTGAEVSPQQITEASNMWEGVVRALRLRGKALMVGLNRTVEDKETFRAELERMLRDLERQTMSFGPDPIPMSELLREFLQPSDRVVALPQSKDVNANQEHVLPAVDLRNLFRRDASARFDREEFATAFIEALLDRDGQPSVSNLDAAFEAFDKMAAKVPDGYVRLSPQSRRFIQMLLTNHIGTKQDAAMSLEPFKAVLRSEIFQSLFNATTLPSEVAEKLPQYGVDGKGLNLLVGLGYADAIGNPSLKPEQQSAIRTTYLPPIKASSKAEAVSNLGTAGTSVALYDRHRQLLELGAQFTTATVDGKQKFQLKPVTLEQIASAKTFSDYARLARIFLRGFSFRGEPAPRIPAYGEEYKPIAGVNQLVPDVQITVEDFPNPNEDTKFEFPADIRTPLLFEDISPEDKLAVVSALKSIFEQSNIDPQRDDQPAIKSDGQPIAGMTRKDQRYDVLDEQKAVLANAGIAFLDAESFSAFLGRYKDFFQHYRSPKSVVAYPGNSPSAFAAMMLSYVKRLNPGAYDAAFGTSQDSVEVALAAEDIIDRDFFFPPKPEDQSGSSFSIVVGGNTETNFPIGRYFFKIQFKQIDRQEAADVFLLGEPDKDGNPTTAGSFEVSPKEMEEMLSSVDPKTISSYKQAEFILSDEDKIARKAAVELVRMLSTDPYQTGLAAGSLSEAELIYVLNVIQQREEAAEEKLRISEEKEAKKRAKAEAKEAERLARIEDARTDPNKMGSAVPRFQRVVLRNEDGSFMRDEEGNAVVGIKRNIRGYTFPSNAVLEAAGFTADDIAQLADDYNDPLYRRRALAKIARVVNKKQVLINGRWATITPEWVFDKAWSDGPETFKDATTSTFAGPIAPFIEGVKDLIAARKQISELFDRFKSGDTTVSVPAYEFLEQEVDGKIVPGTVARDPFGRPMSKGVPIGTYQRKLNLKEEIRKISIVAPVLKDIDLRPGSLDQQFQFVDSILKDELNTQIKAADEINKRLKLVLTAPEPDVIPLEVFNWEPTNRVPKVEGTAPQPKPKRIQLNPSESALALADMFDTFIHAAQSRRIDMVVEAIKSGYFANESKQRRFLRASKARGGAQIPFLDAVRDDLRPMVDAFVAAWEQRTGTALDMKQLSELFNYVESDKDIAIETRKEIDRVLFDIAEEETRRFYRERMPIFANFGNAIPAIRGMNGAYLNIYDPSGKTSTKVLMAFASANFSTFVEELTHAFVEGLPFALKEDLVKAYRMQLREPSPGNPSIVPMEFQESFASALMATLTNRAFVGQNVRQGPRRQLAPILDGVGNVLDGTFNELVSQSLKPGQLSVVKKDEDAGVQLLWQVPYTSSKGKYPNPNIYLWNNAPVVLWDGRVGKTMTEAGTGATPGQKIFVDFGIYEEEVNAGDIKAIGGWTKGLNQQVMEVLSEWIGERRKEFGVGVSTPTARENVVAGGEDIAGYSTRNYSGTMSDLRSNSSYQRVLGMFGFAPSTSTWDGFVKFVDPEFLNQSWNMPVLQDLALQYLSDPAKAASASGPVKTLVDGYLRARVLGHAENMSRSRNLAERQRGIAVLNSIGQPGNTLFNRGVDGFRKLFRYQTLSADLVRKDIEREIRKNFRIGNSVAVSLQDRNGKRVSVKISINPSSMRPAISTQENLEVTVQQGFKRTMLTVNLKTAEMRVSGSQKLVRRKGGMSAWVADNAAPAFALNPAFVDGKTIVSLQDANRQVDSNLKSIGMATRSWMPRVPHPIVYVVRAMVNSQSATNVDADWNMAVPAAPQPVIATSFLAQSNGDAVDPVDNIPPFEPKSAPVPAEPSSEIRGSGPVASADPNYKVFNLTSSGFVGNDSASSFLDIYQSAMGDIQAGRTGDFNRKMSYLSGVLESEVYNAFPNYETALISLQESTFDGAEMPVLSGFIRTESSLPEVIARAALLGDRTSQPNVYVTADAKRVGYRPQQLADGSFIVPAFVVSFPEAMSLSDAKLFAEAHPELGNMSAERSPDGRQITFFMVPEAGVNQAEAVKWNENATNAAREFFKDRTTSTIYSKRIKLWSLGSSEYGGTGTFTEYNAVHNLISVDTRTYGIGEEGVPAQAQSRLRSELGRIMSILSGQPVKVGDNVEFGREFMPFRVRKEIANAYDMIPDDAEDPMVGKAYVALADQLKRQFKGLERLGFKVKFMARDPDGNYVDPYAGDSGNAVSSIFRDRTIYIRKTDPPETKTAKHESLMKDSGFKTVDGEVLVVNDLLRAIQDSLQHAVRDTTFGRNASDMAYIAHAMMTKSDPLAVWALAMETRVRETWMRTNGFMVNPDGTVNTEGPESLAFPDKNGLIPFAGVYTQVNVIDEALRKWMSTRKSEGDTYDGTVGLRTSIRNTPADVPDTKPLEVEDPKVKTGVEIDIMNAVIRKPPAPPVSEGGDGDGEAGEPRRVSARRKYDRTDYEMSAVEFAAQFLNTLLKSGASGDASPILMQNWALANPLVNPDMLGRQFRLISQIFFNPNLGFQKSDGTFIGRRMMRGRKLATDIMNREVRSLPYYDLMEEAGLFLGAYRLDSALADLQETKPDATLMDISELGVDSDVSSKDPYGLLQHIPGQGQSERFYTLSRDMTKMRFVSDAVQHLIDIGYNPTPLYEKDENGMYILDKNDRPIPIDTPFATALRDLAHMANLMSGDVRVHVNDITDERVMRLGKLLMFSPRWVTSRLLLNSYGRGFLKGIGDNIGPEGSKFIRDVFKANGVTEEQLTNRQGRIETMQARLLWKSWMLWLAIVGAVYGSNALSPHTLGVQVDKFGTRLKIGDYSFRMPGAMMTYLEIFATIAQAIQRMPKRTGAEGEAGFGEIALDLVNGLFMSRASSLGRFAMEAGTGRDVFGNPSFISDQAAQVFWDQGAMSMLEKIGLTPDILQSLNIIADKSGALTAAGLPIAKYVMWWPVRDTLETFEKQRSLSIDRSQAFIQSLMVGAYSGLGGRVQYQPDELKWQNEAAKNMVRDTSAWDPMTYILGGTAVPAPVEEYQPTEDNLDFPENYWMLGELSAQDEFVVDPYEPMTP